MKSPSTKSGTELKRIIPELKEVARGNRPEIGSDNRKLEDKLAELDAALHREILLTEPLLELPGERNLKTVLGYPEQGPCSCLADMIYYKARPITYIFWDVQL